MGRDPTWDGGVSPTVSRASTTTRPSSTTLPARATTSPSTPCAVDDSRGGDRPARRSVGRAPSLCGPGSDLPVRPAVVSRSRVRGYGEDVPRRGSEGGEWCEHEPRRCV